MRILWVSNPPWAPTGYGEQAGLFGPRIAAQGHELAFLCNWGLNGADIEWQGFPCYPSDGFWTNRNLPVFAERLDADLVIALCDAWVLKPDMWPDSLEVALWVPVDHHPVPPAVLNVLNDRRVTPVAMSQFGWEQLAAAGLEPLYVPHGVDTTVFRPMPEIRDQVRDGLGLPRDAFVAGMVAANTSGADVDRKQFDAQLQAFARFADAYDDAWLYMHTDFAPVGMGIDLNVVAELAKVPAGRIRYPDPAGFHIGFPREIVAATLNAFDVLLHCSAGEGFGLASLEAQACGVPVITSRHSAMTELCGAGWLVDGDPWLDYRQQAYFYKPHVDSIVEALELAYQARDDQELRSKADTFAADYDADTVAERYWRPVLAELAGVEAAVA